MSRLKRKYEDKLNMMEEEVKMETAVITRPKKPTKSIMDIGRDDGSDYEAVQVLKKTTTTSRKKRKNQLDSDDESEYQGTSEGSNDD